MAHQFDHLRSAAKLLSGDCNLRQVIPAACDEFWAAMYDTSEWPAELLEKANRIVEQILQDGPIRKTLANLDDDAIQRIADDIKRLAVEMETNRDELPPSA
jgi:hypothetical protein